MPQICCLTTAPDSSRSEERQGAGGSDDDYGDGDDDDGGGGANAELEFPSECTPKCPEIPGTKCMQCNEDGSVSIPGDPEHPTVRPDGSPTLQDIMNKSLASGKPVCNGKDLRSISSCRVIGPGYFPILAM